MDDASLLYTIGSMCLLFGLLSAYLIYNYVQDERRVVAKLKLKQEFKNLDPSNYAQIEASNRAPTRKGGKEKVVLAMGKDTENVRANGTARSTNGHLASSGVDGATTAVANGAVVLPAATGAAAGNRDGVNGGVPESGEGWGGSTETGGVANKRVTNGVGGGGGGFGGSQVAVIAGGAAVVGAVTGAAASKLLSHNNNNKNKVNTNISSSRNNGTNSHMADTNQYNDEDLKLNLYNDKEMTPVPEVAAVAMFKPQVRPDRPGAGANVVNVQPNNSNTNYSDDEGEGRARKGRKPKKPVAKLLRSVENPSSDFEDYRGQSGQEGAAPPPQPANYTVPTPLRELDKHVIREQARQTGNVRARQPHGLRF